MAKKTLVSCCLPFGEFAHLQRVAAEDGVSPSVWMRDALLAAVRISEARAKREAERATMWTPITHVTPGMTEITASLVEKDGE